MQALTPSPAISVSKDENAHGILYLPGQVVSRHLVDMVEPPEDVARTLTITNGRIRGIWARKKSTKSNYP